VIVLFKQLFRTVARLRCVSLKHEHDVSPLAPSRSVKPVVCKSVTSFSDCNK
jgi:hypothetical protein